jgi:hypothetical protein
MAESEGDAWNGGFAEAERQRLVASLSTTVSQRLQWVEQALAFAAKAGALKAAGVLRNAQDVQLGRSRHNRSSE